MTKPKFVKRKKANSKRAIILFVVLLIFVYLFMHIDEIIESVMK
jgi:cell division protein FtsB